MRALIVDDEPLARHDAVSLIGCVNSGTSRLLANAETVRPH